MKRLKTLLLTGASFFALAGEAMADPLSIGITLLNAFTAVTGTVLTVSATAVGTAALAIAAAGLSYLSIALRPKPQRPSYESLKREVVTNTGPETRAIGRVRVGGNRIFGNASGYYHYRVIARLRGPIDAVEAWYIGGREVVVDPGTGYVSSPPWAVAGGSYAILKDKVGDGTETAWTELTSAFPDYWTADHRVRGVAQTYARFANPGTSSGLFGKLYQQGIPESEEIIRAEMPYDPRDETTAWSDNGALCVAHVLNTFPAFPDSVMDWDSIGAAADAADASTATKTGTEAYSRTWGMWTSEDDNKTVMSDLLASASMRVVLGSDGLVGLEAIQDDPGTPELTLYSRHIYEYQYDHGVEGVSRKNICRVSYYAPERNYEMTDIDMTGVGWARIDDEVERYGEQYFDVALPFCPSASQAQRIARRLFALERAHRGTIVTNMAGVATWGRTFVNIEFDGLGENGASEIKICAIDAPRVNEQEGTVEIPFAVWPTLSPWNPETDEAAAPDEVPDLSYAATIDTPAAPTNPFHIELANGTKQIRVKFTGVSGGSNPEVNYRTYTGGIPNAWQSMTENSTYLYAYADVDLEGELVEFRVRLFDGNSEPSKFSDVTTADPLAQDNSTPTAPVFVSKAGGNIGGVASPQSVTFRNVSLNAVRMVLTAADPTGGTTQVLNLTPGQTGTVAKSNHWPAPNTFTAVAYSQNGTASATTTYIHTD